MSSPSSGGLGVAPPPQGLPAGLVARAGPERWSRRPAQIERLEHAIAREPDAVRSACLGAERASLLARLGFQAQAEAAVAELRLRHGGTPHPLVTPSINLADAIVERSPLGSAHALVKLRRAHALARVGRQPALQALVAAWLAHTLWNELDAEGAAQHARESLALAAPDDHAARARACLVVGEMLMLSGDEPRGVRWFAQARQHAAAIGDDATKSALAFNLFTVQVLLLRDAVLGGRASALPEQAARHESISGNLDRALGVQCEDVAVRLRAALLSLLGRPAEALALFERRRAALDPSAPRTPHYQEPVWTAHEAWCRARLGHADDARSLAAAAVGRLTPDTQIDDRAAVHAMAARVYEAIGDAPAAVDQHDAARSAWRRHAAFQAHCLELCASFALAEPAGVGAGAA